MVCDFCDYLNDFRATMTGSHRRRIRREPDAFFAENLAEILPETARKNGCSISGGESRAKQAAKERPAERRIKAITRRFQAWQYRDSGNRQKPPERPEMACARAKEKRPFGAWFGGGLVEGKRKAAPFGAASFSWNA